MFFYFTLKAIFVLDIIRLLTFQIFKFKESLVKKNLRRSGC